MFLKWDKIDLVVGILVVAGQWIVQQSFMAFPVHGLYSTVRVVVDGCFIIIISLVSQNSAVMTQSLNLNVSINKEDQMVNH